MHPWYPRRLVLGFRRLATVTRHVHTSVQTAAFIAYQEKPPESEVPWPIPHMLGPQ